MTWTGIVAATRHIPDPQRQADLLLRLAEHSRAPARPPWDQGGATPGAGPGRQDSHQAAGPPHST
ncbi:hypothetical protein [Streptacidiphilus sp. EB103A]|uniref:hypothetical protein n=1 Tax=Streptacidiphilus sp. EB103A TaxID=3156275 RepID=UPI0035171D32